MRQSGVRATRCHPDDGDAGVGAGNVTMRSRCNAVGLEAAQVDELHLARGQKFGRSPATEAVGPRP